MTRKFALELTLATAVCVTLAHSALAQSPALSSQIVPVCKLPAKVLDSSPAVPGTLATNSNPAPKPKAETPFQVSVKPDYLPSWETNQPLAYLRYGAAPAVVTLHFKHKEKPHDN